MPDLIPAAAYARVSTEHQVEDGLSIPAQLDECRKWGAAHGYDVVMEFVDAGKSGSDTEREELLKMRGMAESRHPPFRAIVVWKSDRIARNAELALVFRALLQRKGIELVSVTEPNIDGPIGQLINVVMAGINEFYPRQLADSTLRGGKKGTMDGFAQGGTAPDGMRKVDAGNGKKKYEPDPLRAPLIRRIYEERAKGKSLNELQRWLRAEEIPSVRGGRWESNQIWNILYKHQLVYLGHLVYNRTKQVKRGCTHVPKPREDWVICRDAHEPIITQDLADRVNMVREATKHMTPNPLCRTDLKPKGILCGLTYCGLCGAKMTTGVSGTGSTHCRTYYHCTRNTTYYLRGIGERCTNSWLWSRDLEDTVTSTVRRKLSTGSFLLGLQSAAEDAKKHQVISIANSVQVLERDRAALKRKVGILQDAILDETIPREVARPKMQELVRAISQLEAEIERAAKTPVVSPIPEELLSLSQQEFQEMLDDETFFRRMLFSVVDRIEVDPEKVVVKYRFLYPPEIWKRRKVRRGCTVSSLVRAIH